MPRHPLSPPLESTFEHVYQAVAKQPNKRTPELVTTGGVRFVAEAKETRYPQSFCGQTSWERFIMDNKASTTQQCFVRESETESVCMACDATLRADPCLPIAVMEEIHADLCLIRPDSAARRILFDVE